MILNGKLVEVSPGYYEIAEGIVATLEQIVQLRTGKRPQGMNANCEGVPPTTNPMRIVNLNANNGAKSQEHLELPSTMQTNEEQSCSCNCTNHRETSSAFQHTTQKHPVVNDEHLPLPVMNFQKSATQPTVNVSEEHLIPPSSHRRKK
jgi:hypothetical protein